MKAFALCFFLLCISTSSKGFSYEEENTLKILEKIYNIDFDNAQRLIEETPYPFSENASIFLCKALLYKWKGAIETGNISEYRKEIEQNLEQCISLAKKELKSTSEKSKMNFLILSSHGFMAEQHYRSKESYNALLSGKKAYEYMKKGFNKTHEFPDFLYTTGLYNYYRVKLPEKHPYYRSFLWMFKAGDATLGIQQLKQSHEKGIYSKFESLLYLVHILMRYECDLNGSESYAKIFYQHYPKNPLSKIYYAENAMLKGNISQVENILEKGFHENFSAKEGIESLLKGFVVEKKNENVEEAEIHYKKCIEKLDEDDYFHRHLISLAYVYIAKIQSKKKEQTLSKESLKKADKYAKYPIVDKLIEQVKNDLYE